MRDFGQDRGTGHAGGCGGEHGGANQRQDGPGPTNAHLLFAKRQVGKGEGYGADHIGGGELDCDPGHIPRRIAGSLIAQKRADQRRKAHGCRDAQQDHGEDGIRRPERGKETVRTRKNTRK